jgi:hypothetical protein
MSRERARTSMALSGYAKAENWELNRKTITQLYRNEHRKRGK